LFGNIRHLFGNNQNNPAAGWIGHLPHTTLQYSRCTNLLNVWDLQHK
jgi:hypothetical protein